MFRSVVFPAPEGPMIAVSSPGLKHPETPFKICFLSGNKDLFLKKEPQYNISFYISLQSCIFTGMNTSSIMLLSSLTNTVFVPEA